MRNYPDAAAAEIVREEAAGFWLLDLELAAASARYTSCDIPLYRGGLRYEPSGLRLREVRHSAAFEIDTATVTLDAASLELPALLLSEDAAGRPAELHFTLRGRIEASGAGEEVDVGFEDGDVAWEPGDVVFAGGATPQRPFAEIGTVRVVRGFVLGWRLDRLQAEIRIANVKMLWRKRALRLPTDSCPWVFRGAHCGYAGAETWCDRSAARCQALGNRLNFGGRRAVLALETKQLIWGVKGTTNVQ